MKPPRLFDEVMEVVARIKSPKGYTFQHIVHEVQLDLRKKNISIKNVFELVKQALLYGNKSGLIVKKEGHYQMALSREDYNIYKKFRSGDDDFAIEKHAKSSKSISGTSESEDDSVSVSGSSQSSKSGKSGKTDCILF